MQWLKRGRNILAGTLIALLLVTAAPMTLVVNAGAEELEDHWVKAYAQELIGRGILETDADDMYLPDSLASREDLIKWIVAGSGADQSDPIGFVSSYGILDDMETSGPISRNETAKLTVRSLKELFGEEEEGDDYLAAVQLKDFAACQSCRNFTSQCYVRGLMIGRVKHIFDGDALLTRAEAWTVVARMLAPELRLIPESESDGPVLIAAEAAQRILDAESEAIILDVRNEDELVDGYIPGSILIPLAELMETEANALSEHMTDPIIIYCKSGGRSAQAREYLEGLGFTTVYDLGGVGNWTFDLAYPD